MKKYLTLAFGLSLLLFSCEENKIATTTVCEKIQFSTPIVNESQELDYWINNIEGPKRDAFVNKIVVAIKSGKIKAYDKSKTEIEPESLGDYFNRIRVPFHILSPDENGEINPDSVVTLPFSPDQINRIIFNESWRINEQTLQIEKTVNSFCLAIEKTNPPLILQEVLWIYPDTTKESATEFSTVTEKIQNDVLISSSTTGTDWYKNNLVTSEREKFIALIIKQVYEGKVLAHNFFEEPMTTEQVKQQDNYIDTISFEDPLPPHHYKDTVVQYELNQAIITKIRFIESWSFDENTFKFYKTVNTVVPLKESYNAEGRFRGYSPMFWIYFDKQAP